MWNVIFYWCLHISVLFNKFISPVPGNLLFYVTTTLWNYRRNSEPETAQNWRQCTKFLSGAGTLFVICRDNEKSSVFFLSSSQSAWQMSTSTKPKSSETKYNPGHCLIIRWMYTLSKLSTWDKVSLFLVDIIYLFVLVLAGEECNTGNYYQFTPRGNTHLGRCNPRGRPHSADAECSMHPLLSLPLSSLHHQMLHSV